MTGPARIVCCVRRALDWNLSTKDFRIDQRTQEPVVAFARYRIDQFDEIAVEIALQAKHGAELLVHAVSAATAACEDVLKHALAMGADGATLVDTSALPAFDAPALLAAAIQTSGGADVVLCGRTGSACGCASTGPVLAELLELPLIANVVRVERDQRGWICTREDAAGYERVAVAGPFVGTVTNASFNLPRAPTLKDKMKAHRQRIEVLPAQALAEAARYAPSGSRKLDVLRRYVPHASRQCRRLDGDVAGQARAVADYIRSALQVER